MMAVRDEVVRSPAQALALLQPWAPDADENIRRFASELTRPRGVWCAQIESLKAGPCGRYQSSSIHCSSVLGWRP
jgi:3-methyladenine DNA glycosylase AlkC